ncbi:cellulase family glycosylhydrolase [Candidatus Poribacteria bacterium]|nr:cellulase family glycosylhydrolase [Candidatus Poribacteria bacterium]
MWKNTFAITCLGSVFALAAANAAPWIEPDWDDKEPEFPPGSLFWKTNEYPVCPIVYRTIIEVKDKPFTAGFQAISSNFIYIYLNGNLIGDYFQDKDSKPITINIELGHLLHKGENVLAISTKADGFALSGYVIYEDGEADKIISNADNWKVMKFPPLTMLDFEPCMKTDFDSSSWFPVKEKEDKSLETSRDQVMKICQQLSETRLKKLDEDAKWRLKMLGEKGIAVVEWEAYGWCGIERHSNWILEKAIETIDTEGRSGWKHSIAEALTWYFRLMDEITNLENHLVGLEALEASESELEITEYTIDGLIALTSHMRELIDEEEYSGIMPAIVECRDLMDEIRSRRIINDLCSCVENKFGWFDTNALLDSNIEDWGLSIDSPARMLASPLSPAIFITAEDKEFVLKGWNNLEPVKVYNKPQNLGPIGIWVVLDGKVRILKPDENGIVYDLIKHGKMEENWILLVTDLSAGAHLPEQLVFTTNPEKIVFKTDEKGTNEVYVEFDETEEEFFLLRPFKEWRGLLRTARIMTSNTLDEEDAADFISQCRLWSRALLMYPVTFSEIFTTDPGDRNAIICADVYNYWDFEDEWGTEPLTVAPLPPLATYGLMTNYPGLEVISDAEILGSRGIWGDHIAAVDQEYIIYRVPLDKIKRFGGFTSYCFGNTDIGEPGSITEIETIVKTGANTFRPQHNQTGERAMKTLEWCWERGIQNVFNTDEKWVPDIVEHFRKLAEQCKDYPPDAVAYDLLNEPETREYPAYNALIQKITHTIRSVDKDHLIYVEAFPPWGPGASPFPQEAFRKLKPTGDELTVYSFHDYEYRLPPRWPNQDHDITDILKRWIPAFKFAIDSRRPMHLGEFGGFEQTEESVYDNACALTLMMDYLKIFDQFGWHWHYYANRGTVRVLKDGSLQDSYVQEAHRRYFSKGTFNFSNR